MIKSKVSPETIAIKFAITPESVHQYIYRAIGDRNITYIDVLLALSPDSRLQHESDPDGKGYQSDQTKAVRKYERFAIAELYSQVREIERKLHQEFREALVRHYGDGEKNWWRQGVPPNIRLECVKLRENDAFGAEHEPFAYTMLIDLGGIARKQWEILKKLVGFLKKLDQNSFLKNVHRLNSIRNQIMHPIRIRIPNDDDILFVSDFHKQVHQ